MRCHELFALTLVAVGIVALAFAEEEEPKKSPHNEWHTDRKAQRSIQAFEALPLAHLELKHNAPSILVINMSLGGKHRTTEVQYLGTTLPDTLVLTLYTHSDSLSKTYIVLR